LHQLKIYSTCFFVAYSFLSGAQTIKLPVHSNIYADTIALYWGTNIHLPKKKISDYAAYFKFETIFEDVLFTTNTTDSLIIIPFDQNYADEQAFHVICIFHQKGSKTITEKQELVLKSLSRNDEIEALRSLVSTNTSLQNLQLLADAYELEACYVNAYQIYWRMLSIDSIRGKENFEKFYQRNFKVLNPPHTFSR
jgi:hypothetical protein